MLAAQSGRKEIVELLLKAGAYIDSVDDMGYTACHIAAWYCRGDVLSLLLELRPNLAIKDLKDGGTALDLSFLRHENVNVSLMLIKAGAPLDDVSQDRLCKVALLGTGAVQTLLDRGVAVRELRDSSLCTPLHYVAETEPARDPALANMLVNVCGIDLGIRNSWGATCVFIAVIEGNADALRCFLAAGAPVEAADNGGRTPLSAVSDYECAILLLAAGADVNKRDRFDNMAFLVAASAMKTAAVAHAFLAAGADIDRVNERGFTARQFLAQRQFDVEVHDQHRINIARRDLAKTRLDFVRSRALQVCIGLQSRQLDALQLCEILQHACGPLACLIEFHRWWKIATTVKHFGAPI